jgi:hypothetical protein
MSTAQFYAPYAPYAILIHTERNSMHPMQFHAPYTPYAPCAQYAILCTLCNSALYRDRSGAQYYPLWHVPATRTNLFAPSPATFSSEPKVVLAPS